MQNDRLMDTTDRVINRFPRFYNTNYENSKFFQLCHSFCNQLDETRKDLFNVMRSHWIESANGPDLDLIGSLLCLIRGTDENDDRFRHRIIQFIDLCKKSSIYPGGGTIRAIKALLALYLETTSEEIKLIENPPCMRIKEWRVSYKDEWEMDSSTSIYDENFSLMLTLHENKNQDIKNPEIVIGDNSSIKFNGAIKAGQKLVITEDGRGELDGIDVTESLDLKGRIKIDKRGSRWSFKQDILSNIGKFDEARYDQNIFEIAIPIVNLGISWTDHLRSTFEIKLSSKILNDRNFSKEYVEEIINYIKAEGVRAIITIEEKGEKGEGQDRKK